MISFIRTNSQHQDFGLLVAKLDHDLKIRDGADHAIYAQYNKTASLQYVVLAYENEIAIGCGALRPYTQDTIEIKRMYVEPDQRKRGIASGILKQLEEWAVALNATKCILETGKNQPEAIAMYLKNNYHIIANYGQYEQLYNSVCFEKML